MPLTTDIIQPLVSLLTSAASIMAAVHSKQATPPRLVPRSDIPVVSHENIVGQSKILFVAIAIPFPETWRNLHHDPGYLSTYLAFSNASTD